jgi:hypothetical protein
MTYRLIKEYPGSPNLGTIVKNKNKSIYFPETKETWSSSNPNYFDVMVTNQPEFWAKVVEKNYEILSVKTEDKDNLIIKFSDRTTNCWSYDVNSYNVLDYISSNRVSIHSVKRIIDGEIFTIGDTLWVGKISFIKISNNELWLFHNGHSPNVKLKDAVKFKQPLFVTEDGINIYEGDKFYFASESFNNFKCAVENIAFKGAYTNKDIKIFSTKQQAEKYILMNKRCLSLTDVLSVGERVIADEGKLKQLVKTRL